EHAGEANKIVRGELEAYGAGLAEKPEIVALSKADALDPETLKRQKDRLRRAAKRTPLVLSAASGQGVTEALRALMVVIAGSAAAEAEVHEPAAEGWRP
ncbi:MAG: GTPase ObgE, partial [Variibacter sp.]